MALCNKSLSTCFFLMIDGTPGLHFSVLPDPVEKVRWFPLSACLFPVPLYTENGMASKKDCLKIVGECCDCLVYFASAEKKVFCLAELKVKDTPHAAEQIINAYDPLYGSLNHSKAVTNQHATQCSVCISHFNDC